VLSAGALWIDLDRRVATTDNVRLDLSRREFDLLATFAAHPGIVLSRVRLLELVWGYDFDVDTNVVDVFVGYLRRKLETAGAAKLIDTVRGVGFVLRIA
jgi:two-component system response regulator PrrA